MNYDYCDGMIYTIKKGDTLYNISRSKQVPLSMLLRANPYVDVYNLQVGDTICIPMRRKPCFGRPKPKPKMQGSQDMSENNEIGENIEVTRDESEVVYENQTVSEMMEFDEAGGNDATAEIIQNRVADGNGMAIEGNMPAGNGMAAENRMADENNNNERNRTMDRRDVPNREMPNGSFTRYVAQPGDTLADVMARSDADWEVFWENNAMDRIHLLPGISYLVFEEAE